MPSGSSLGNPMEPVVSSGGIIRETERCPYSRGKSPSAGGAAEPATGASPAAGRDADRSGAGAGGKELGVDQLKQAVAHRVFQARDPCPYR